MATRPDLRISDADRDASAASLREHYAQGRLSLDEFNERLDAIFAATTQGQLDQVTGDLPHVRTPSVPLPVSTIGATSHGGGDRRSRHRGGARRGMAMVAGLGMVLALCMFVLAPTMMHFRLFSLPGRFSVLMIGLMIVRTLFRRIFGGRGRWTDDSGHGGQYRGHGHSHLGRPW